MVYCLLLGFPYYQFAIYDVSMDFISKKLFLKLLVNAIGFPLNITGLPALLHHEYLDITFSHLIQLISIKIDPTSVVILSIT